MKVIQRLIYQELACKKLNNNQEFGLLTEHSECSGLNLVAYAVVNTEKRKTRIKLHTDL